MRNIFLRLSFSAFCCFFAVSAPAQEINTEKLNSFLDRVTQENRAMGSVVITRAGKTIYSRSFGNLGVAPDKMQKADKYRIGSNTKLFTATLIHQLAEKGELELQETLDQYFPDIPNAGKITLAHLLNHTSGLGDFLMKGDTLLWGMEPLTEQEILEEIRAQGVKFEPGTDMKYSNSGYFLLTKILERTYGKKYPQIVSGQLLGPLNMTHTLSGVAEDATILLPYRLNAQNQWEKTDELYLPNFTGLGEIAATPGDLAIFLNALFGGRLVSEESLKKMMPQKGRRYGMGIMQSPFHSHVLYGHSGATLGTQSLALYDRENHLAVVACINGIAAPCTDIWVGIFNGIYPD